VNLNKIDMNKWEKPQPFNEFEWDAILRAELGLGTEATAEVVQIQPVEEAPPADLEAAA
jgi:hypothetical protein